MNIISKINLRKALRFFLLLAALSVVVQFSSVSANTEKNQGDGNDDEPPQDPKDGKDKGWFGGYGLWVAFALGFVLVVCISLYFYMNRNKEDEA